jgi:hypothetical protein
MLVLTPTWSLPACYTKRKMQKQKTSRFARLAVWCGNAFGSPFNFGLWLVLIALWLASGPIFHYSDTWQLAVNTPTTIIELFSAILIQYVGNRIERRQEEHETKMLKILEEVQSLSELMAANMEQPGTVPVAESATNPANAPQAVPVQPTATPAAGTVVQPQASDQQQ